MKAGVIGLGAMGAPMAHNLRQAGLLEAAWNRSRGRLQQALAGAEATWADSPAAVIRRCEVCILSVSRDADVLAVVAALAAAANAGKVVVCERFTCSTYAYQGHGRGLDGELIATLERRLLNDCRVDLTILLDLPVEAALRRLHAPGKSNDRFHHEPRAFLDAVHAGYRSLNRQHQGDPHWQVIAADAPMDTVATHIATALQPYLAPA